ncbi:MAG: hypothetical protein LQ347_005103 [Umbilicaria vellea]|nr:MAG: hypothetical protein LQ347_005103 [Umbilicaria vellea]
MSSTATPIPLNRFTEAITTLPLSNLHFKAAELRNSIAHLEYSNLQLQPFAEEGDHDCKDAIAENKEVIRSMKERIECLKKEVEGRGFAWGEEEEQRAEEQNAGHVEGGTVDGQTEGEHGQTNGVRGTMEDEDLARRIRETIQRQEDDEEDGVHL